MTLRGKRNAYMKLNNRYVLMDQERKEQVNIDTKTAAK